jgi:hypothetical protein
VDFIGIIIPPLFAIVYYVQDRKKDRLLFSYLLMLWIVIPWVILSTYRGELTDSYFSIARNVFIAIISYLTVLLYEKKSLVLRLVIIVFWGFYVYYNLALFFIPNRGNLLAERNTVKQMIQDGKKIPFVDKDPKSYLYYLHMRKKNIEVY